MADDINPRQFSSSDNNGLFGSLTNRPPSSTSVGDPIDFEAINRQVINARTQPGYIYKESAVESTLRKQQDIAASLRIKQETADAKAANALQDQQNQAQRNELKNRINNSPTSPEVAQPTPESPLSKAPPPSTPQRQPTPSTGRPPPTANGTAARASPLVEPTATPPPAMPAERIPPPPSSGGFFDALPRSLPQAAGRVAIPGAFAAGDFAVRVFSGQATTQAASGAVASTAGAFAGAIVGTAIAGPVGEVIGGMIGGYVGGAASDYFFHSPPSTGSPPAEAPNYPPFRGGQGPGVLYTVAGSFDVMEPRSGSVFVKIPDIKVQGVILGPIEGIEFVDAKAADGQDGGPIGFKISGYKPDGSGPEVAFAATGHPFGAYGINPHGIEISRADGTNEIYPDTTAPAPPPDNQPYYFAGTPLNADNTIGSGFPAAGTNKGKNRDVVPGIPGNNTPNGNGYFPGHGGLAPGSTPNPSQFSSNLGGNLPSAAPAPAPPPFAQPKDVPPPRFAPAPGGSASSDPGGSTLPDPNVSRIENGVVTSPSILIAQPIPLNSSLVKTPTSSPRTSRQNPVPDGVSPLPKAQAIPTPNTPETTANRTNELIQQQKKDFDGQIAQLTTIGGLIAGLTPIVQGIPDTITGLTPMIQGIPDAIAKSPTVQAANKKTTQGAVCEIAQPGGCLGDALDNSADKINQNNNKNTDSLLDKINAGANAAQLALLEIIDAKLGEQLVGGISGFLKTFFDGFNKLTKWLHLDRALNLLTFVMTVQNVYFLCDSMKVVTLQMISDMLSVLGIKDKDDKTLNLNEILGSEVESLLKSILGEQELSGFKKEWKPLNRIYQAATNTLFAIQNMVFSVLQSLEIIGSWNASIGNALKKYLVVGQKAFEWMNPNPNFHNNFFKFMGEALNVVTSLDFIAQSILQGRQAIDDFGKQTDELSKGIAEASDGFKPPENKATAEAATKSANESKSPIPSPEDVKSIQD